jgi:hypothetical protein
MRRVGGILGAVAAALLGAGWVVGAQLRRGGLPRQAYAHFSTFDDFDGGFQFCRLAFRNAPNGDGDGDGWSVDWPRADENLSVRASELTRIPVSVDEAGRPKHILVRATDPELAHCPLVTMTEPGGAYFDERESAALRDYLVKGGFLWADDFWGEYAWRFWENQLRRILPAGRFPIVDLTLDHPVFHQVLSVPVFPQIPGIGGWRARRITSERGTDSAVPHARVINDEHGRVMVLMTHNTDFGDSYEREGDDREYFERFSVPGYAFGINVLVYALTHSAVSKAPAELGSCSRFSPQIHSRAESRELIRTLALGPRTAATQKSKTVHVVTR